MKAAQYQPGTVLPGSVYRVVRHLATGGMGSVYEVEDTTVEKRYVLKTLHPNLIAREDLAIRMRDEARSLAKLQHPNIVDVITAGVTTDALRMPFYVMERLLGQNLRVVLEKRGPLDLIHACRIAIDVADALEHAHEHNIVHRDVKPENIFLHRNANGTTTTKLLDFGIVRLLDRKASHTRGKFIGTLRYASPEQVSGGTIGPATDVYALGAVLFEMIAGRGPFDDVGDAYAIGAAHAAVPAPRLSSFIGVSPDVERLVAQTLAKDPAQRPHDCFSVSTELRRILGGIEAGPGPDTVANVLSSVEPSSDEAALAELGSSASTAAGMVAPSVVETARMPEAGSAGTDPTVAGDLGPPVSPIAPTIATEGIRQPHSLDVPVRVTPPPARGGRPGVDRSAPTRPSTPSGATRRIATNDTQMDGDVASSASTGALASPSPPNLSQNPTGPLAGEAGTRPPERGPFILVGVAAALAVAMVGGAFAARRPWQSAERAAAVPTIRAGEALPTSSASSTSQSVVASPSPVTAASAGTMASAPPGGVPRSTPSEKAARPIATPTARRATPTPPPSAPAGYVPTVGFDP